MQGEIRLELRYTPLLPLGGATLAASQEAREAEAGQRDLAAAAQGVATQGGVQAAQAAQEGAGGEAWKATLSTGFAKGGSEGVDWSTLARRVGTVGTDDNAQYALCCFQLLTTYYSLLTTYYSLLTTYYLPLTTYYLLQVPSMESRRPMRSRRCIEAESAVLSLM